jgi:hypothetical protein
MDPRAKLTWWLVVAVGCALIACGDDDSPKDGGGDADHGDHGHEDSGADDAGKDEDDAGAKLDIEKMSFFVASDTSKTGNLGGLKAADDRCNRLAKAAGVKDRTFAAYLSAEKKGDGDDSPVHARDRIGKGPWYNARGVMLAKDLDALHALPGGDAELFLNEKGAKINGQWEGSPSPNEHDILTGTTADGMVMVGFTCSDWTSAESGKMARVGHSDGLGPSRNPAPPYNSWNSSHNSPGCNDTAPAGGAGHIYCFAVE